MTREEAIKAIHDMIDEVWDKYVGGKEQSE